MHVVERNCSTNIAELHKQFGKDWDITKKIQVVGTEKHEIWFQLLVKLV